MNELKLEIADPRIFETRLQQLGGKMGEPCWYGNWYLEATASRVLKIMQIRDSYRLLELQKLDKGFAFVSDKSINDISIYRLHKIPDHNILHKTVRSWQARHSVDLLVFDDIGTFACVNYEEGEYNTALDFILNDLHLSNPAFIEVPFNVLKRRKLGLADFD